MADDIKGPTMVLHLDPGSDKMSIAIDGNGILVRSAEQLEAIIAGMISLREMMTPAIPFVNPTKATQVITTERMRWSAQSVPSKPGTVHLMLLHPGLGWIGMAVPPGGAQELAATILRCAQPAGSGRPN